MEEFLPRFNIAPTQRVPVVTGAGRLEPMTWGIVPAWAKEQSKALINARAETIREKRTFKAAFSLRRCLLPADGFYEWRRVDKRPYLLTLRGDAPFAIGAIWEPGEGVGRCCLLTTFPNALLNPIHDRMPVIVRAEDWAEWLSPAELGGGSFERITTPYDAGEMSAVAVSPLVNSGRIDDARCCEPAGSGEAPRRVTISRKGPATADGQGTFGF